MYAIKEHIARLSSNVWLRYERDARIENPRSVEHDAYCDIQPGTGCASVSAISRERHKI